MKMKNLLTLLVALTFTFGLSAQTENLIQQADEAYMNDKFEEALELYLRVADENGSSSQLYYNIGNTYYRMGELGKSILYYRRALKLDPTNQDARANLTFVEEKTIDRQDENKTLSQKVAESVIFSMTPNGWSVTALILFVVLLGCIGAYVLIDDVKFRKLSFFGGIVVLVLDVLVLIVAFKSSALVRDNREAIVIEPMVQLSTVPRLPKDKSEQAFTLHEGAHLEIIDSLSVPSDSLNPKWLEIKVDDVHRAWLPAKTVERI